MWAPLPCADICAPLLRVLVVAAPVLCVGVGARRLRGSVPSRACSVRASLYLREAEALPHQNIDTSTPQWRLAHAQRITQLA